MLQQQMSDAIYDTKLNTTLLVEVRLQYSSTLLGFGPREIHVINSQSATLFIASISDIDIHEDLHGSAIVKKYQFNLIDYI